MGFNFIHFGHPLFLKIKKIVEQYQKIRALYRFAINGVLLFFAWMLFYKFIRYQTDIHTFYESVTNNITILILHVSQWYFDVLNYETQLQGKVLRIIGTGGIYLDRGCIGRNLMGMYAGFVIAYPGRFVHKIWYVPLGIVLIILINTWRVAGLVAISYCCVEHIGINHDVIFKYSVYAMTFLLWYIWIKKFADQEKIKTKK